MTDAGDSKPGAVKRLLRDEFIRLLVIVPLSAALAYYMNSCLSRDRLEIVRVELRPSIESIRLPREHMDALLHTQAWIEFSQRGAHDLQSLEATATDVTPAQLIDLRSRVADFLAFARVRESQDSTVVSLAQQAFGFPSPQFELFCQKVGQIQPARETMLRLNSGAFDDVESIRRDFERAILDLRIARSAARQLHTRLDHVVFPPPTAFTLVATLVNKGDSDGAVLDRARLELGSIGVPVLLREVEGDPPRGKVQRRSYERIVYEPDLQAMTETQRDSWRSVLRQEPLPEVEMELTTARDESLHWHGAVASSPTDSGRASAAVTVHP